MSVIVRGMEMPKNCEECRFAYDLNKDEYGNYDCICVVTNELIAFDGSTGRKVCGDPCPLVEVPPHGRLGDLDELYNHLNEWYLTHEHGFSETEKIYIRAMLSGVKDSPTVIPESKED